MRKSVFVNDNCVDSRDYAGSFQYKLTIKNEYELDFVTTEIGKAVSDGQGGYDYVYDLKDHLGNVRLSFQDDGTGSLTIVQQGFYCKCQSCK